MHNTTSTIYPSASQTSSDIVKTIKKTFVGAAPPRYVGEKVIRRTDTNITVQRRMDDWKGDFHRRNKQKSEGFFSMMAHPYEELGETELDTKKLVLKALKDIGGLFDCEKEPCFKFRRRRPEESRDVDDLSKKQTTASECNDTPRQPKHESSGTGFETIKGLLDDAEKKITFLKAGKPLSCFLDETGQVSIEQKKKNGRPSKRGMLIMDTPGHLLKEDSNAEVLARGQGQPDCKARKRYLAKVDCIKTIFCCILNMKNKELRNKNPLAPEILKALKKEVYTDGGHPTYARHRMSAVPTMHLLSNRTHKLSGSTPVENGMNGPTSMATVKAPLLNISTEDVGSAGSRCRLNTAETSVKSSIGLHVTNRIGQNKSTTKLLSLNPAPGHGNTRIDTWESLISAQPEAGKSTDPGRYAKFSSLLMNSKIISNILKPRRGALFPNKGNFDLPIWQRVLQEDARKDEVKTIRKPPKELTKKQLEDAELVLDDARKAFDKMKSKNSDKLQRELDARVGYFRQRLRCLDVSIFPEEDLRNMRNKVKEMQKREDFDNARPTGWYETLCDEQRLLLLENDTEVSSKVKAVVQFSRIELSTIAHLRAKLCLLVMSLPVYELCKLSMQEAIKFFLASVMEVSENNLEDWMISRKLVMTNVLLD